MTIISLGSPSMMMSMRKSSHTMNSWTSSSRMKKMMKLSGVSNILSDTKATHPHWS
jgi:hypothetical protein